MTYANLEEMETRLTSIEAELTTNVAKLDDFNDQYCRLAREGRLDASDSLKLKFIGINGDWDELSDEVASLLKRAQHSRHLFAAFVANRDKEMIWMRTVDARLTGKLNGSIVISNNKIPVLFLRLLILYNSKYSMTVQTVYSVV
jgi:hypothetical protein